MSVDHSQRVHRIEHVLVGKAIPLGPNGEPSAIAKAVVEHAVSVAATGLVGDEQGDLVHHGGREKAIHHYPSEHYAFWSKFLEPGSAPLTVGGFGENISTVGIDERDVCVGDVWRLGSACVQVSQGRLPCWKLSVRFGRPNMALWVQQTGRTGWYYRVLNPGSVAPGDDLVLVHRPQPNWPIRRIIQLLFEDCLSFHQLAQLMELRELAESWRTIARRRIETGIVEDSTKRLNVPKIRGS